MLYTNSLFSVAPRKLTKNNLAMKILAGSCCSVQKQTAFFFWSLKKTALRLATVTGDQVSLSIVGHQR